MRQIIFLCVLLFAINIYAISTEEKPINDSNVIFDEVLLGPQIIYDGNEIILFDVAGENIVACWPDGTICLWDWKNEKIISSFKIDQFDYKTEHLFISKTDKPVLAVVDNQTVFKKILFYTQMYENIYIYDLLGGKKIKTVKVKDVIGLEGIAFSSDGKRFYFLSLNSYYFYSINVETGKIISMHRPGYFGCPIDVYMKEDGSSYMVFSSLREAAAFNRFGEKLWEKAAKDYVYAASQPQEYSDLLLIIFESEDEKTELAAISSKDGEILWRKDDTGLNYSSILAASNDRKKQAMFDDGYMWISYFPDSNITQISELKEKCEAVFSKDGTRLLCLPELKETETDKEKNSVKKQRSSRILKVVDCETGKIIKQYELKKAILETSKP